MKSHTLANMTTAELIAYAEVYAGTVLEDVLRARLALVQEDLEFAQEEITELERERENMLLEREPRREPFVD